MTSLAVSHSCRAAERRLASIRHRDTSRRSGAGPERGVVRDDLPARRQPAQAGSRNGGRGGGSSRADGSGCPGQAGGPGTGCRAGRPRRRCRRRWRGGRLAGRRDDGRGLPLRSRHNRDAPAARARRVPANEVGGGRMCGAHDRSGLSSRLSGGTGNDSAVLAAGRRRGCEMAADKNTRAYDADRSKRQDDDDPGDDQAVAGAPVIRGCNRTPDCRSHDSSTGTAAFAAHYRATGRNSHVGRGKRTLLACG